MALLAGTLMVISLLSIVYGALRCNILAIKIKYDDYEVDIRPMAYLCILLWRSFEIASRVAVLVLFTSVLQLWVLPVVLVNFLVFFFCPWILFWRSHSPFPENIEKTLTKVGTTTVLIMLTFLYAGINMFCWSGVQVKLNDPDLINKSQNWFRMAVYYMLRFAENALLLLMWYIYRTDFYNFVYAPLLVLQLLLAYAIGIFFMILFYQFCHPCRKLFSSSMAENMWRCPSLLCLGCADRPSRGRSKGESDQQKGQQQRQQRLEADGDREDEDPGDSTSDPMEDAPNETTYDMLNDTAYDSPYETGQSVQDEVNGDVCHGVSCSP